VCVCPPIVSVPVRELPLVFGVTVNVIERDPEPAWLSVIQPAVVVAVQKHEDPVVSDTVVGPPPGVTVWLAGLSEYVHDVFAAWLTVKVRPPIVSVPVRCDDEVLPATVKLTTALPLPFAAVVTEIHDTLLTAVHAQLAVVVNEVDPEPPFAATERAEGEIAYEHDAAA
jgi:hypothetical protein